MKKVKVDSKRLGLIVGIVVVVIVIIAIAVSGGKKEQTDPTQTTGGETKVVEGKKLAEKKEYKGLEVSNVKFSVGESLTELTADVYNNSGSDSKGQYVNFNILDENGNRVTSVGGYIDPIKAGESAGISTRFPTNGKESSSYDIQITEKREEIKPETTQNNESNQD